MAGPPSSPLEDFYGTSVAAHLFPVLKAGLPLVPRPLAKALPKVMRLPQPLVMSVAQLIRAIGPQAPAEGMAPYFQHFGEVDPAVIMAIVGAMHDFDARPWLHEVDVPTLVVTAEDDTFCPPEGARVYVDSVPDCEVVEIMDASHVALLEYPTIIHDHLTEWLSRKA